VLRVSAAAVGAAIVVGISFAVTPTGRTSAQACGAKVGQEPTTYSHVIWILMENHSYSQIIGSSSAPYINGLSKGCGLATSYSAITHPSLPNYLTLTSGATDGISDDCSPSSSCQTSSPSIFAQERTHWRSLEESMPSNCALKSASPYVVRHNPAAYYTGIRSDCPSLDVPLGSTPNVSATFTFVTPNVCHDMHDCSVSTGDKWLSGFLPKILNSSTYRSGGTAVFIVWDEDDGSASNRVPMLIVSPYVKPGTRVTTAVNHYGLLRTTEDMLGLGCLQNACRARDFLRSPVGRRVELRVKRRIKLHALLVRGITLHASCSEQCAIGIRAYYHHSAVGHGRSSRVPSTGWRKAVVKISAPGDRRLARLGRRFKLVLKITARFPQGGIVRFTRSMTVTQRRRG
jgi:hypothetical protein